MLLIDNMNPFLQWWDLFIIFLAIYCSIALPLDLSFEPPNLENYAIKMANNIIDVFFFIDIIINFRTIQVDQMTGEFITSTKGIAIYYLKGSFWIDLISTIPFDQLILILLPYS